MKTQILDKQSFQISEEDSKRITSLRFLLIVFVVFIHANLTTDDALNYYHYDFIQPKWIEVFKNFICYTLGGAAVPLFFLFASYLQFSKNDSYPTLLKKRSKSLLLPYILWTVITVILYFIAQSIPRLLHISKIQLISYELGRVLIGLKSLHIIMTFILWFISSGSYEIL